MIFLGVTRKLTFSNRFRQEGLGVTAHKHPDMLLSFLVPPSLQSSSLLLQERFREILQIFQRFSLGFSVDICITKNFLFALRFALL